MTRPWRIRPLSLLAGLTPLASPAAMAQADNHASKPITIVVAYPLGGSTDLTGRTVANEPLQGLGVSERAGTVLGHQGDAAEPVSTPYDDCVRVMPSLRQLAAGGWRDRGALCPPTCVVGDTSPFVLATSSCFFDRYGGGVGGIHMSS